MAFSSVAFAALLYAPAIGNAQSILLSAGDFTLLGGTAITSTGTVGTTIRNGNVGLSPGATTGITGFPPAVIIGGSIVATGAVTAQARLDLIKASVGLAGMASSANMSTVDLGGKTLAPGVYTFNTAASLNGALTLDAHGQNNVAWVFQIGTAFTTSVNSTITFINLGSKGGSDIGLFWNAGSAVNIGANNQFAGNYLAGTSIVFGGLSNGGGRALALAGITLDTNIVNARGGLAGGDYAGGLKYDPSGAVVLAGGSGSTTTVAPGLVDGGTGTFGGNVVNNGTLRPGLAGPAVTTDTLGVAGNFTQAATGTLVVKIASATSFDQLAVAGPATLAGTVEIDALGGYDPLGKTFTFLTAGGGVSGKFGTVNGTAITTNRAAVAASVLYAPTSVSVAFTQLPFAGFALTPNQIALANAAQASPGLTTDLDRLPLSNQFPAALNVLSPQGYQVWSDFAFANATSLADRLLQSGPEVTGQDHYYFEGGQRRGRSRTDMDVAETSYTTSDTLVGVNHGVSPDFTLGGYFAFGKTTSGLGSIDSRTSVKEKTLGLRAAWLKGPLFAEAIVAYGFNDYSATRPLVFPGTAAIATSSTRGHQWTTGVTVGHHMPFGKIIVSPFAGILASRWSANGFAETGAGEYDATLARQSARSLRSQLGTEVRWSLGKFQPHVRAAWVHEFSDSSRAMNASFGSINYAVATRGAPRDSALYSAGLDFVLGPRALLYTDVSAQNGGATKVVSEWLIGASINL
ncbi:MAG: autotransporter domain-containing protein [Lacunisphaera sp.]